ncbi:MAG: endonuclease/exonuclease/phosphatase family protein [Bacteroidota bacterium]|nr:endonuclease/exonuclease/phosphatase family protein [Bacteroidota bacterium]
MKMLIFYSVLLLTIWKEVAAQAGESINVMTYNIRYDNKADSPDWYNRKKYVFDLIKFHNADIIGIQEALHNQMLDLGHALPGFSWVGKARDDGKEAGEYAAILYKEELFDLLNTGTFWLSLTPNQPSKSWDAALPRICTWAKLIHRATNTSFFVYNTHFDHIGIEARLRSSELLIEKAKEFSGEAPYLIMGDFNFSPSAEPYQNFVKEVNIFDAQEISLSPPYGPAGTFNNFKFHEPLGDKIDHIFANNKFQVLRHGALSDSYKQNYPSDHLPVLVEVRFKDEKITSRDRWKEELDAMEKTEFDKELALFTGSSSIRLWTGLQKRFKNIKVLNKGFGGSEIRDMIVNAEKLLFKYYPKQIIIYSGDNDIWNGKPALLVKKDFEELFNLISDRMPETEVLYISIKPSPSRMAKIEEIKYANSLIKKFLGSKTKGTFIDIYNPMLDSSGNPNAEYFVEDNLHLNEKGYELWTKILMPYLKN